jgi:hypothetical protein
MLLWGCPYLSAYSCVKVGGALVQKTPVVALDSMKVFQNMVVSLKRTVHTLLH